MLVKAESKVTSNSFTWFCYFTTESLHVPIYGINVNTKNEKNFLVNMVKASQKLREIQEHVAANRLLYSGSAIAGLQTQLRRLIKRSYCNQFIRKRRLKRCQFIR